jgi:hypothetical protein
MEQQGQQQSQPQQEEHQSINTPSIPSGNDNAALDRQMLRHLMARYSEQELARWILEERGSPHTRRSSNVLHHTRLLVILIQVPWKYRK